MVVADPIAELPPPIMGMVNCKRVRGGQIVRVPILVSLQSVGGERFLTIWSDWSERLSQWRVVRTYKVKAFETKWDGRAYILDRGFDIDEEEHPENYSIFVGNGEEQDICDCRGSTACPQCKHLAAIHWLLDGGHLA